MIDRTGRTGLATGTRRGIGAAAARVRGRRGRRGHGLAQRRGHGGAGRCARPRARAFPSDVSRSSDMAAAVEACTRSFGGLDVRVGTAGVVEPLAHLRAADPERWSQGIDVNLMGVFQGMRAALPVMAAAGDAAIITASSGAAMLVRGRHLGAPGRGIGAKGTSPGADRMQREIGASGINPVSQLDWSVHIPPDWPAKALVWMCTPDADAFVGEEVSLRDEEIRRRVGLVG